MTDFIALMMIVSGICGVLALLGWLFERSDDPLERFEHRWPRTKGWER